MSPKTFSALPIKQDAFPRPLTDCFSEEQHPNIFRSHQNRMLFEYAKSEGDLT
jgi:hypothetical protein